jgi:DNA polymerase epsilon subunit 1
LHQFPILTLEFAESDDFFDDRRQNWHVFAFENFTTRFIQITTDLQAKKEVSQILNTPIGNVAGDICMQSLDLLFARELIQQKFVMWYSEASEPDVGQSYPNELVALPGDPFSSISHNERGTYLSRCIEYRLSHLSTSAIIECQTLIDQFLPQHAQPEASDFSSKPSVDAVSLTAPVFGVLSKFLFNIVANSNDFLASMIGHVGTWLSSTASAFHDPALHSVFRHFLNIIFGQMIAHFNSHDLRVVFADQSRIILNIGQFQPDLTFAELKNKSLLKWIDFSVLTEMDKLVWIDEFNFQGVCGEEGYISGWNVNRFLSTKHSSALADFVNNLLLYEDDDLIPYFKGIAEDFYKLADETKYAPSLTDNQLRNPLDETKSDFLLMVNTFFFAVENLGDARTQHEIHALRANVLKILGLGEFDPRTRFVDPSLSLVIPSVLCRYCLSVRNIDVLRDEVILETGNWTCCYCQQPYDVRVCERWIFEEFARRYQAYVTQDLRCTKCQRVHARRLALTCEDGGALQNSVTKEELLQFLNVVGVAARRHAFRHLNDTVETFRAII